LDVSKARCDRLSGRGYDVDYRLTEHGADVLTEFGVDLAACAAHKRPLVGYCVDWSDQRHHLAGALGRRSSSACWPSGGSSASREGGFYG
jgi:hypothetical protein